MTWNNRSDTPQFDLGKNNVDVSVNHFFLCVCANTFRKTQSWMMIWWAVIMISTLFLKCITAAIKLLLQSLRKCSSRQRQGAPGTGCQSITKLTRGNHSYDMHTYSQLTSHVSLDCGKKPELQQKTHVGKRRTLLIDLASLRQQQITLGALCASEKYYTGPSDLWWSTKYNFHYLPSP